MALLSGVASAQEDHATAKPPPSLFPARSLERADRDKHLIEFDLAVLKDAATPKEIRVAETWRLAQKTMEDKIAAHAGDKPSLQRLYRSLASRTAKLEECFLKSLLTASTKLPDGDNLIERQKYLVIKTQDWVLCTRQAVLASDEFIAEGGREASSDPEWKDDPQAQSVMKLALDYAQQIRSLNSRYYEVASAYLAWAELVAETGQSSAAQDKAVIAEQTKRADLQKDKAAALQRLWVNEEVHAQLLRSTIPWL